MPHRLKWIDGLSKAAAILAVAFFLCGLRVWGDDYSHGASVLAQVQAEKDRAIIAAIQASSSASVERDRQKQESINRLIEANSLLIERIDALTAELQRTRTGASP